MKKRYIKKIKSDPDKCLMHTWRHLCRKDRAGKPVNKPCEGLSFGACKNLICISCSGLGKDRKEYQCFKCKHYFWLFSDLDTDKPTCDSCFDKILKINTLQELESFIG